MSKIKYVAQSKLKKFRESERPKACPITGITNPSWAVDHCHNNGMIRGVISSEGNAYLGRVENAFNRLSKTARTSGLPQVLRNIADYLERPNSKLLHPKGCLQLCGRFNRLTKDDQVFSLKKLGYTKAEISDCSNSSERTELYKRKIKNDRY